MGSSCSSKNSSVVTTPAHHPPAPKQTNVSSHGAVKPTIDKHKTTGINSNVTENKQPDSNRIEEETTHVKGHTGVKDESSSVAREEKKDPEKPVEEAESKTDVEEKNTAKGTNEVDQHEARHDPEGAPMVENVEADMTDSISPPSLTEGDEAVPPVGARPQELERDNEDSARVEEVTEPTRDDEEEPDVAGASTEEAVEPVEDGKGETEEVAADDSSQREEAIEPTGDKDETEQGAGDDDVAKPEGEGESKEEGDPEDLDRVEETSKPAAEDETLERAVEEDRGAPHQEQTEGDQEGIVEQQATTEEEQTEKSVSEDDDGGVPGAAGE